MAASGKAASTSKKVRARKTAKKTAEKPVSAKPARKAASRKASPFSTEPRADAAPAEGSLGLVERVAQAVDRELAEIEGIVGTLHGKSRPTEAERRARTLASLARTLSEVRRLRAADETQKPDDEPSAARDLEEFRKILFKRLEEMPGRAAALPAAEDDAGGDA
jgi:plasmid stabilization system protein ParE